MAIKILFCNKINEYYFKTLYVKCADYIVIRTYYNMVPNVNLT